MYYNSRIISRITTPYYFTYYFSFTQGVVDGLYRFIHFIWFSLWGIVHPLLRGAAAPRRRSAGAMVSLWLTCFLAHVTSFNTGSILLTFFCFFVLFHSCCLQTQVFGKILVHEFHIPNSHILNGACIFRETRNSSLWLYFLLSRTKLYNINVSWGRLLLRTELLGHQLKRMAS